MRRSFRKHCLVLSSALALVGGAVAGPATTAAAEDVAVAATPPNVIVVLVDDMRFDDLTTMPATKSLLADQGVSFSQAYAPFSLCCPARATLLTGQYAHNHGVLGNSKPLGGFFAFKDKETIATWLDPTHQTAWMGKYFNQYGGFASREYVPPGWDDWRGALGGSFSDFRGTRYNRNGFITDYFSQYQSETLNDFSTSFIEASAPRAEPFFLMTSYFAPHTGTPIESDDPAVVFDTHLFDTPNVSDKHRNAFHGRAISRTPAFDEADISDKPSLINNRTRIPAWQVQALTEADQQRRESLLSTDDGIREMVASLRATGELDNTYIIFTSDNGMMMGDHRVRIQKNFPYEGSAHVPMIIRGPGIPAGVTVHANVGHQDIVPTILDMTNKVGAQGDFTIDGRSLLPLVANPQAFGDRPIVIERGNTSTDDLRYIFEGVRNNRWKYIEYPRTGERELYDMVNDPHEMVNRAGDPDFRTVVTQMNTLLDLYRRCAGAACN